MAARDLDVIRLSVELSELMMPGCDLPAPNEKLITRGGGSTLMPYFFACRNGNDLFICIRGAAEPADFLLVLDYESDDFQGGKVHRGTLRAARWIIAQTRNFIDDCQGRIICCGHSLGGATSGMVATVLVLEEGRQNVIGVCQAPFPIMSRNLAQRLEPFISSFVYRNDVVPRLSTTNIGMIVRMFVPPGANQQSGIAMIQGILQQLIQGIMQQNAFFVYNQQSYATLQAQFPEVIQRLVRTAQGQSGEEFVLPGRAYLLGLNQDGFAWVRRYTDADAGFNIGTLITSIMDHNGQCYEDTIFQLEALE